MKLGLKRTTSKALEVPLQEFFLDLKQIFDWLLCYCLSCYQAFERRQGLESLGFTVRSTGEGFISGCCGDQIRLYLLTSCMDHPLSMVSQQILFLFSSLYFAFLFFLYCSILAIYLLVYLIYFFILKKMINFIKIS